MSCRKTHLIRPNFNIGYQCAEVQGKTQYNSLTAQSTQVTVCTICFTNSITIIYPDASKRSLISEAGSESIHCLEPWANLPKDVLPVFWKVVYWSAQILTW